MKIEKNQSQPSQGRNLSHNPDQKAIKVRKANQRSHRKPAISLLQQPIHTHIQDTTRVINAITSIRWNARKNIFELIFCEYNLIVRFHIITVNE